jgi:hypothetical protein
MRSQALLEAFSKQDIAMRGWIIAAAFAVAAAGAAQAQPGPDSSAPGAPGGSRGGAMREACRADIEQVCGNTEPGGGRIGQCLREHQDRLSAPCKSAMSDARANRRQHQSGQTPEPPATPPPAPN